MQRFGTRTLWVVCFAIAVVVAAGHLLTAEPRRRRIAALSAEEKAEAQIEAPPVTEALSG